MKVEEHIGFVLRRQELSIYEDHIGGGTVVNVESVVELD